MIAAIYARKSTEQNGVNDEEKSVTRQIDHAKAYAIRKGWTVPDEYIYVDDGISGAEFLKRPGFIRLMNDLKPKPAFQVLIISEESRLGREAIETAYAMKQLVSAGVRVFLYMEDRERTLDSATDKIMLSLTAFADELEREKARQRTHDAMIRKARAGQVTGGKMFGYRNVEVLAADPTGQGRKLRAYVMREVNEEEACIVRRIFDMYAMGKGFIAIAKELNVDGIPAPRSSSTRKRTWAPSCVRVILHHDLYRGEIVWNRSRKRDRMGLKHPTKRPESEWIRLPAPELRIVSDQQWHAAHDQLRTAKETYLRSHKGQLWGRPANGIDSKYLLTGLGECGACGGSICVRSRSHGKQRHFLYVCMNYHLRGRAVCANSLEMPMERSDRAVLEFFERKVLCPAIIVAAVSKAVRQLTPSQESVSGQKVALRAKLTALEEELTRLTTAVARGGNLPTLIEAIKERELEQKGVRGVMARLEGMVQVGLLDHSSLQRDLENRLKDWHGLASRQVTHARQILKKLLIGRIRFDPKTDGAQRFYEFSGKATIEKVIAGSVCTKALVSPTGFEPVLPA